MKDHFEHLSQNLWFDKNETEIIERWNTEFHRRCEQITEIQKISDKTKWKTIELDYVDNLSVAYLKQRIKDFIKNN
jgi:hypothetical protein